MKKMKDYNLLLTGFQLLLSVVPIVVLFIIYFIGCMVNDITSTFMGFDSSSKPINYLMRFEFKSVNTFIDFLLTDVECRLVMIIMITFLVMSIIKYLICTCLNRSEKIRLMYELYGMSTAITSVVLCIVFIASVIYDVRFVIALTGGLLIIELIFTVLNIICIEELY